MAKGKGTPAGRAGYAKIKAGSGGGGRRATGGFKNRATAIKAGYGPAVAAGAGSGG